MSAHQETYGLLLLINANIEQMRDALIEGNALLKQAETQTKSLGDAFKVAGGIIIANFVRAVGRELVSTLSESSRMFQDYQLTLTKTALASGATADEMDDMVAQIDAVSKGQVGLGYSALEAAEAMESLVKAGFTVKESSEALKAALMLARIESVGTAEASNVLVQVLTQFHKPATEAENVLTLMSQAADSGIDTLMGYAAGLSNAGTNAYFFGATLEETLGALVVLDKHFGNATESGTFLNMMFRELTNNSEDFGIELYDAEGNAKSFTVILSELKAEVDRLGTDTEEARKYLAQFEIRAQQAGIALTSLNSPLTDIVMEMGKMQDVTGKFGAIMDTTAGQIETVQARLDNYKIELGETSAEMELAWLQFTAAIGPIGVLINAIGPSMLQGAFQALGYIIIHNLDKLKDWGSTILKHIGSVKLMTNENINLGLSLAAASLAFGGVYSLLMSLDPETRSWVSTLVILGGALAAATIAAVAFWTGLSAGVATPFILTALGVAAAGVAVKLQDMGLEVANLKAEFGELEPTLEKVNAIMVDMAEKTEEQVTDSTRKMIEMYREDVKIAEISAMEKRKALMESWTDIKNLENLSQEELIVKSEEYARKTIELHGGMWDETIVVTENGTLATADMIANARQEDIDALVDFFEDRISTTKEGMEGVVQTYTEYYAGLEEDARSFYDEQVKAAEDAFDEQMVALTAELDNILQQYGIHHYEVKTETELFAEEVEGIIRDHYANLRADNDRLYDDNKAKIEAHYQAQLEMYRIWADQELSEYGIHFVDLRTETEILYDDIMAITIAHFDDKEEKLQDDLAENRRMIEDNARDEIATTREKYDTLIDNARAYWDGLIDQVRQGLSNIRDLRNHDMMEMELEFLIQKDILQAAYANEIIDKGEFEKQMSELEDIYNEERSEKRDAYRIQELEYQLAHWGEEESLIKSRNEAVIGLENRLEGEIFGINQTADGLLLGLQDDYTKDSAENADDKNKAVKWVEEQLGPLLVAVQKANAEMWAEEQRRWSAENKALKDEEVQAQKEAAELLQPALLEIQTNLEEALAGAINLMRETIEGIYDDMKANIAVIMWAFKTGQDEVATALWLTEVGGAEGRAAKLRELYSGMVGQIGTDTATMLDAMHTLEAAGYTTAEIVATQMAIAKEAVAKGQEYTIAAENIAMDLVAGISGYSQMLLDKAAEEFARRDFSNASTILGQLRNLGTITQSEYDEYMSQIPHGAEGGIVTRPTLMMVGEKGTEAIIPLDKAGYGNIEVIINVTGNTFSNNMDVEEAFRRGGDILAQKLVSMGIGRVPH